MSAARPLLLVLSMLLCAASLAGCAGWPGTPPAASTPAAPATPSWPPTAGNTAAAPATGTASAPNAAPPAAAAAPPGSPPPFAVVVKDARRIDGALTLWQRDDKVWIELPPAVLGKPYLLSPKIRSGIGEGMLLGGLMLGPIHGAGGPQVVEFVRVHNQIRLLARNTDVAAPPGTPEARALDASYSPSLLGSTPVASQPHPERKSVLIDAGSLFLSDLQGIGMRLQAAFRQGYGLDLRNSVITAVRGSPQAVVIETQQHFYTGSIGVPSGAAPGAPGPSVPRLLPDARSMLIGMHHSLSPLPEQPMAVRRADPRIGLFSSTVLDFGADLARSPRTRHVQRWRLEKKDPAAALSEPVKPITFWIDRNVPLQYRDTVRDAILEWNKAFVAIGFKDAIAARQQPDDANFDTLDFGHPSVRWMSNLSPTFVAIGPSNVDPRSGEILDANIAFEGLFARQQRSVRAQLLPLSEPPPGAATSHAGHERCEYGDMAALQTAYAIDVLSARGELDPGSPEAQQFVLDYVKETIMHEVGHALGLRHNFRASRAYSEEQLSDPEFTRQHGTTGSVMDYNAVNLPRPGAPVPLAFQGTLGPYDLWVIEYAYRPLPPGATAADEAAMLQTIAARSAEPLLAYGSDEDSAAGIDPETLPWDLGADPVEFAAKRLEIARDLFQRQESRELPVDRDYSVLRRSLSFALVDVGIAARALARQIGGMRTLRDFPGSGRDPLAPVPLAEQRRALDLIARSVLSADALAVSPALQRRLAPDYLDRIDLPGLPVDYAVPQRLLELQRGMLSHLLSDAVAARIIDSVGKADQPSEAFQLSELYERLTREVWGELETGSRVGPLRRELQREHLNRVAAALLRPASQGRADQRSLLRLQGERLLARIDTELRARHSAADAATHAHLSDSARTLREALGAGLLRGGF